MRWAIELAKMVTLSILGKPRFTLQNYPASKIRQNKKDGSLQIVSLLDIKRYFEKWQIYHALGGAEYVRYPENSPCDKRSLNDLLGICRSLR